MEDVETSSDYGPGTSGRYTGQGQVIAAQYGDGVASARVHRLNADGTEGFLDIVVGGGQVTVNGGVDTVQASAVCA